MSAFHVDYAFVYLKSFHMFFTPRVFVIVDAACCATHEVRTKNGHLMWPHVTNQVILAIMCPWWTGCQSDFGAVYTTYAKLCWPLFRQLIWHSVGKMGWKHGSVLFPIKNWDGIVSPSDNRFCNLHTLLQSVVIRSNVVDSSKSRVHRPSVATLELITRS